jgi:hypothetical protein
MLNAEYTQCVQLSYTNTTARKKKKRNRINFISPKLVTALDQCKLSVRESNYIIQAIYEGLDHNVNSLVVNKSFMHRFCVKINLLYLINKIKIEFQSAFPNYITLH